MNKHYDKTYFDWQKKAGEYGAQQDTCMYQPYIKKTDVVLDFGVGGGYILSQIICKRKYGVDINEVALKEAKSKKIETYMKVDDIPRNVKFDVIMSHHTLEHVESPATILKSLMPRLKSGGTMIFVLPINDWRKEKKYDPKDINKHLYTWTPLLLGNLFVSCGYKVKKVEVIEAMWLPLSRYYYHFIPKPLYRFFSKLWSEITLNRQIRIIVER